jgi:tetratricopeptide (TPR) repeat protein
MVRWLYQNRFAEAAEAFAAAARVRAGRLRPQAFGHRGYCLLALGKDDEAVASFEEAWRLEPSHVALGLADAWAATGRETAATAFLEGIEAESEVTEREARRRLALLAADGGRFHRAVELLAPVATRLQTEGLPSRALLVRLGMLAVLDAAGEPGALAAGVAETAPLVAPELLGGRELDLAPVPVLAVFGSFAARAGRLDLARESAERARAILAEGEVPLWRGYEALLAGEIALAEGRPADAVATIATGLQAADVFALHDGLARAKEAAGDPEGAIVAYRWIVDRRGRAFAECFEVCGVREANVLAWSRSLARLGALHAERGDAAAAAAALDRLVAHWSAAEDAERLAHLRESRAALPRS